MLMINLFGLFVCLFFPLSVTVAPVAHIWV